MKTKNYEIEIYDKEHKDEMPSHFNIDATSKKEALQKTKMWLDKTHKKYSHRAKIVVI